MKIPKILIIGGTGQLGIKLIKYCFNNKIKLDTVTCYNNIKKLNKLKKNNHIQHTFVLSDKNQKNKFINFLQIKKFNLVYFLDYGSSSLEYAKIIIRNNSNTQLAIANKEMIIAGGSFFIRQIKKTKNHIIPLDSEHFSLSNLNLINSDINKIFITASGGPFYFNKSTNLNKVVFQSVINHPKWKMGINNSIDSSNFINKLLEIFELSALFGINKEKINFLISKEAYIHSVVIYEDNRILINCFDSDMLISLISPLRSYYKINNFKFSKKYLDNKNLVLENFKDNRFKINNHIKFLKNLSHNNEINLVILNNLAHKLYINNKIKYNNIIEFIVTNLNKDTKVINLNSFNKILKYIKEKEKFYEDLVV